MPAASSQPEQESTSPSDVSSPGTNGATPLIHASQLVKHYGQTAAVRGVSFSVMRGEVVGFLGPNGAGKSTTMKMLTGFLRPTSGRVRIAGIDMAVDARQAQRHIGYLPENAPLYDDMMVLDFLQFVADVRQIPKERAHERLRAVIERCGLTRVLGKDIGQLSKGYRQRVGLAQALVDDPDLLILDEPTSGLDPNQIVEIRALIRDLGRDKTVLLSTHILSEVQAVCNRAIIISEGAIVADAAPEALGQNAPHQLIGLTLRGRDAAALEVATVQAKLMAIAGVQAVRAVSAELRAATEDDDAQAFVVQIKPGAKGGPDVREAIFDVAVANHWRLIELHQQKASLEETFQRLTGVTHGDEEKSRHAA